MTHEVTETEQPQRLSVTVDMATRYGMNPVAFERVVRSVCMPVKHGDPEPTREEFAAFLLVAKEHRLNPITREIYAMKRKGGGLVPVVGVDGWARLANDHPAFDGMEFESEHDGDKLLSTTCRIYRKDRRQPIAVTEYLSECIRDTEPWKMRHRMLRHKAMIQCARYAFSFAGIYDPDEAERFAEPLSASTAPHPRRAPSPNAAPAQIEHKPEIAPPAERQVEPAQQQTSELRRAPSPSAAPHEQPKLAETAQRPSRADQQQPGRYDPEKVRKAFAEAAKAAPDRDALNAAWDRHVDPWTDGDVILPPDRDDLDRIYSDRARELDEAGR